MSDVVPRDEINKRFTLNWLIQGAAQHAGMTIHHLMRDELNALDDRLLILYDQHALINLLQYWSIDAVLIFGWPARFWKRAASDPNHPFFTHPLLRKFGGELAQAGRLRALNRCQEKRLTRHPFLFENQAQKLVRHLEAIETPHRPRLIELAKKATSTIWGIGIDRLAADLKKPVPFGTPIQLRNFQAQAFHRCMVGLGGVVMCNESLMVVGEGTNWQLLTKELVKGTAELISLHGLNNLSDETYRQVVVAADRIEYEPWMLQTGGELWRRLLPLFPEGRPVAQVLMQMACLPPRSLESMMLAAFEQPDRARGLLRELDNPAESPIRD